MKRHTSYSPYEQPGPSGDLKRPALDGGLNSYGAGTGHHGYQQQPYQNYRQQQPLINGLSQFQSHSQLQSQTGPFFGNRTHPPPLQNLIPLHLYQIMVPRDALPENVAKKAQPVTASVQKDELDEDRMIMRQAVAGTEEIKDGELENLSDEPPSRVIHFRNIGQDVDHDDVRNLVAPFGKILKVVMLRQRQQCMVMFAQLNSAIAFLNHYIKLGIMPTIRGKKVHGKFSRHHELLESKPPSSVLLVTMKMPMDPEQSGYMLTVDWAYNIFHCYGKVERLIVLRKLDWQILVQYSCPEEAGECHDYLDEKTIFIGLPQPLEVYLQVQFSHLPEINVRQLSLKSRDYVLHPFDLPLQQSQTASPPSAAAEMATETQSELLHPHSPNSTHIERSHDCNLVDTPSIKQEPKVPTTDAESLSIMAGTSAVRNDNFSLTSDVAPSDTSNIAESSATAYCAADIALADVSKSSSGVSSFCLDQQSATVAASDVGSSLVDT